MNIGERIKKIRAEKRLSTYDVANLTGISQSVISKLENGKRKADNEILEKLAKAFEVSTDRLTGESVSSIIENRLEETGMSLNEVAQKSGVPLHWLQSIDTFIPGQIGDYEIGYDWITRIADVLGVSGGALRAALARQEIPMYEGSVQTSEEAFKQVQNKFNEPNLDSNADITSHQMDIHYYINDETREIAQEVFENPDLRSLFHVARDIDPEELRAHIDFMKRLKAKEKKNDDYEGC